MLKLALLSVLAVIAHAQDPYLFCDFETDWCGMESETLPNGKKAWLRAFKRTVSSTTGPEQTHANGGGDWFVHLEPSSSSYPDLKQAPFFYNFGQAKPTGQVKLSFYYHAHGSDLRTLSVQFKGDGGNVILNKELLGDAEKMTNQNDPWVFYTHTFTFNTPVKSIEFIGDAVGWKGDWALDDIKLENAGCGSCGQYATCQNQGTDNEFCQCNSNFNGNGYTCEPGCGDICHVGAICGVNANNNQPQCQCPNKQHGSALKADGDDACFAKCDTNGDNFEDCHQNAECATYKFGFSTCQCKSGYTGDGFSSCQPFCPADCHPTMASCQVIGGVAQCVCNNNKVGNGLLTSGNNACFDKCTVCGPNGACGFENGIEKCLCNSGYSGNGFVCTPNCPELCHPEAGCQVAGGVADCKCQGGLSGNGLFSSGDDACTDLCGTEKCHEDAECVIQFEHPTCVCKKGYACSDVCITPNLCSKDATCNIFGGKEFCLCDAGYVGDGLATPGGSGCTHKCELADCNKDLAKCTLDNFNNAQCTCNQGYSGDGKVCADINECQIPNSCKGQNTYCLNSEGSFSCECIPNYHPADGDDAIGADRSCPVFLECTFGKSCECSDVVPLPAVPDIDALHAGVNSVHREQALAAIDMWSPMNVDKYCKMAMCNEVALEDLKNNVTFYQDQVKGHHEKLMEARDYLRRLIDCNEKEALEKPYFHLYDEVCEQGVALRQVLKDLNMKLVLIDNEIERCESDDMGWFRKSILGLKKIVY